ncbi:flagellar basal body-associated protein FliL [Oceaniovalibus guishaninsula JLT2003]|uniref:Flagellar protein FliL n=1 Tax=Oceaniovalibus guishaninsula JLT2003 TaxID=1231392 RepID=K2GM07_9RHOB|nr:flagellar basal body-associated FliL family protein [Oceaniovalibus guishaninsula]EKE43761.1 flagellar basal body-associated protein FliL [Oceaniovalibus guishaninsula JLT2003]
MADATADAGAAPTGRKKGKLGLVIGLAGALALGGGGFYAAQSGMIFGSANHDAHGDKEVREAAPLGDIAFVPLPAMVVSLAPGASASHLSFEAQLEVPDSYGHDVEKLVPRVVDVLNSYLRAIDPAMLERPAALTQLRAQMLRRVQIVVGEGRVNDLLIMEFVLS